MPASLITTADKRNKIEACYDTYAGLMYGCILKITDDENEAELILQRVFSDLYQHPECISIACNPVALLKFVMAIAIKTLTGKSTSDTLLSSTLSQRISQIKYALKHSSSVVF